MKPFSLKFPIPTLIERPAVEKTKNFWQREIVMAIALGAVLGTIVYLRAAVFDPILLENPSFDIWFEADLPRTFANIIARDSNHFRTRVHPLFSLIAYFPVFFLKKLGLDAFTAVKIMMAALSALWIVGLYILLRLINCRRFDAILFCSLAASSSAAMFWFVVPETYTYGSLTILLGLLIVALDRHFPLSPVWYLLVSAATLSITTTNWMVGIISTFISHRWQKALQITVNAFSLVVGLWFVQYLIFPYAEFFLKIQNEKTFFFHEDSGGMMSIIQSFIAHTMIMPEFTVVDQATRAGGYAAPGIQMITQTSVPGSASYWGAVGVGLWAALLALGISSLFSLSQQLKFRLVLGLTIFGQLGLHLIYGEETFLYSLHFLPLLITLAALSLLTNTRLIALVLAGLLLVSASINNSFEFDRATKVARVSSIVIPSPNNSISEAGYHRLGGSFSPPESSFVVTIWIRDKQGNMLTTSDNIDPSSIQPQLIKNKQGRVSEIATKTQDYHARWSLNPHNWQLNLAKVASSDRQLILAVRSLGSVRGEVRSLNWKSDQLIINNRWSIHLEPIPQQIYLGREEKDWITASHPTFTQWQDYRGLGYALFKIDSEQPLQLNIQDLSLSRGK